MKSSIRYSEEVRERAVRMVVEHTPDLVHHDLRRPRRRAALAISSVDDQPSVNSELDLSFANGG